jgi:hypothetical protein
LAAAVSLGTPASAVAKSAKAAADTSSSTAAESPVLPPLAASASDASVAAPAGEKVEDIPAPASSRPAEEQLAEPADPSPVYVEHLGASAYPGKLRGIYGGSLWLEPSFNGLQWPYMAKSGVGVSGSIWVDSGYEKISREAPRSPSTQMYLQQGRAVLRVTPTYTNGRFFIQGQVEMVGNQCQVAGNVCLQASTFDTDDLWIRVGHWNLWDLKVGRFEGWELYHTGMGLDINTLERLGAQRNGTPAPADLQTPNYYGVNYLHDRPSAGLGVGYVALHLYPTEILRFEMLGELGTDNSTQDGQNYLGVRPSAILDMGWLKIKLGSEYEKVTKGTQVFDSNTNALIDSKARRTRKGFGGCVLFVLDPAIEFGANIGVGRQFFAPGDQGIASATSPSETTSVGGFVNFRPANLWLIGAGANWTTQYDTFYAAGNANADYMAHLQGFGAVQYLLAKQLFIKAVFGYARADFQPSDDSIPIWSNYMYSARVRLMYLY